MTLQQKYEAASNRADELAAKLEASQKIVLSLSRELAAKAKPAAVAPKAVEAPRAEAVGLQRTIAAFAKK